MGEWLLLLGAKGLKAVIVGGLSALSFGVDVVTSVADRVRAQEPATVVVVVRSSEPVAAQAFAWAGSGECQLACSEEPWARVVSRKAQDLSRPDVLVQLGTLVPPILVEALFPPDLLLPRPVLVAKRSADPDRTTDPTVPAATAGKRPI